MTAIDSLPADQRAALQLLLKQGQTYDQLASLLGIGPDAVRARAHTALDTLGEGSDLPDSQRAAVADYLLGQQSGAERDDTRALLAESGPARRWAQDVAGSLRPLAGDSLPEIPAAAAVVNAVAPAPEAEAPAAAHDEPAGYEAEAAAEAPAEERPAPTKPSSRLGGALLLGGVGIIIAVVLILIINGGGDDGDKKSSTLSTNPATRTNNGQQRPVAQINLSSASGNSRQVGLAQVFENGNRRAIIVAGQGLFPGAYALWLYNSRSDSKLLGFVPQRVGRDGRFATQGELPSNANRWKQLIVTRERVTSQTRTAPQEPGEIVLQGDVNLG